MISNLIVLLAIVGAVVGYSIFSAHADADGWTAAGLTPTFEPRSGRELSAAARRLPGAATAIPGTA
ncbi:hypothetical protein GCM10023094_50290 [Rhodococcus olei]|uniref:Uncharacterized protein n=1 Tax=Rhodococcus olei TaxID=2161675 RepID=A0ABP8PMX2_9NOCA